MAMSDWLPETEEEKSTECSYNLHYIDGFGEIQTPRFNVSHHLKLKTMGSRPFSAEEQTTKHMCYLL